MERLIEGYRRFRADVWPGERERYRVLAEKGQRPETMVIACSDSRVDPQTVFGCGPGELFVVRNVAALVPPFSPDGGYHGTSAALEFAVVYLEVEHIIVLGHSGCGGIKALLTGDPALDREHTFIHHWMQITDEARRRTLLVARQQPIEVQLRLLTQEAIKTSLANLLSFPWINERVEAGLLRIHGWRFDLEDGNMYVYVPERDSFEPLDLELATRMQNS